MRRRAVPALLALGLAVLLVPPAADASEALVISGLTPSPGTAVAAGDVELIAHAHADHPVTAVRAFVNDEEVTAAIAGHAPGDTTQLLASVVLAAGEHAVRVEVEDADGRRGERSWWVTATDRDVARHAGPGRIDTAVAVSEATFPTAGSAPAAVLARADAFPDALAGIPLAVAVEGPLLLSRTDALPAATADELGRVLAPGAVVHLLGGRGALSDQVAGAVATLGFETHRHGGADRYATAAAIARALPASPGAVLASGTAFPDALAASAPAAREGWPILLTAAGHLPGPTAEALAARAVGDLTLVGGTAAVSTAVERDAGQFATRVTRVAGSDRYATAAAIVAAFYPQPSGASLASGADFPDALAGARHAVLLAHPLLLTRPERLPSATADALRARRPHRLDVYGGAAAVADHTVASALQGAVDGPDAPRVVASSPAGGQTVADLDTVTVRMDRPVDPSRSSVYVEVAGAEVLGTLDATAATATLTFRARGGEVAGGDTPWPGRMVVRAVEPDGTVGRDTVGFTYQERAPAYASVGDVTLHLPSRGVDMIGFHQARHLGAQQQVAWDTATPTTTLPSRNRGTGSRTAADVVADPALPVLAPVTGRVLRAGSYILYCRHHDDFVVIEPDARPGWEVKALHVHGLRVGAGDRVQAGDTVIAAGPRALPFASQVDQYAPSGWPHVHLEVIDPSVPSPPSGDC